MTEIHTENLILRRVGEEHIPFIQEFYNDADILKFMSPPVPNPYPANGAEHFVTNVVRPRVAQGTFFAYIIYRGGEPIGSVGSQLDDAKKQEWHRGFWLAAPHRGLGKKIMEEASWALVAHVFAHTEAKVVVSENAPSNLASAKISSNQGFLSQGRLPKNPGYHNGENETMRWVLTREEFAAKAGQTS